jgi:hypothetical protein
LQDLHFGDNPSFSGIVKFDSSISFRDFQFQLERIFGKRIDVRHVCDDQDANRQSFDRYYVTCYVGWNATTPDSLNGEAQTTPLPLYELANESWASWHKGGVTDEEA